MEVEITGVCKDDQPKERIKIILRKMVTIETNPLIRELLFGTNIEKILKRLFPELLGKYFTKDSYAIFTLIKQWTFQGINVKEDPIISGVLRSLLILTLHEKEFGTAIYRETLDLFINLIVVDSLRRSKKCFKPFKQIAYPKVIKAFRLLRMFH